jgi:hypothetical protein
LQSVETKHTKTLIKDIDRAIEGCKEETTQDGK